jgi:hypothetical protein
MMRIIYAGLFLLTTLTTIPTRAAAPARRLNNLVTELIRVPAAAANDTITFTAPRAGWCYFSAAGGAGNGDVRLDDEKSPLLSIQKGESAETMRRLSAGSHVLHCTGRPGELIVRAVPELQYAFFDSGDQWNFIHGRNDNWPFIEKYLLGSTNVIISSPGDHSEHFQECLQRWTSLGRRWITTMYNPYGSSEKVSVDEAYQFWSKGPGFQNPLMDGILVDEFGGGERPKYESFAKAVQRIGADPKLKGKSFSVYSYGATLASSASGRDFARACFASGGNMCIERYLAEQPTRQEAQAYIHRNLTTGWNLPRLEQNLKGVTRNTIIALGDMSALGESLNVRPDVDFKVFLDMQMRELATDPAFDGLGGIQAYHSGYADDETVRWICRLYRHYAVEGKTNLLSDQFGYEYHLDHIANPDFAGGLQGWELHPAAADSLSWKHFAGFGFLEFRFGGGDTGDHFLVMKRSDRKANIITQKIQHLIPGKLYSLKLVDGDYDDLVNGVSKSKMIALPVQIDNAQVLDGGDNALQRVIHSHYDHPVGPFKGRQHPYFMNFHWQVFRALTDTAVLRISDWKSAKDPGGPPAQQTLVNFIEIQPYFSE